MLLILAAYSEKNTSVLDAEGKLQRNPAGDGENTYEFVVNAEGLEDYNYSVTVAEELLTKEEAQNKIYEAEIEIDESLYAAGENASRVTQKLNMKDEYVNGLVTAEWLLSDYDYVEIDGSINEDTIPKEGVIVEAQVELTCNEYKEIYTFPFHIYQRNLSEKERIIKEIDSAIAQESNKTGTKQFALPREVGGIGLEWKESNRHLVIKVLFLELAAVAVMIIGRKENEKQQLKRRQDSMRLDYSEIVSKMAILMGAGMSIQKAWNRISARYSDKGHKNFIKKHPIYEEMLTTSREIQDGMSERNAYQRFGERTGLGQYHRFSRLLIQNMQKGNRGICSVLEEESEKAFEERRLLAKKMGEEAGTKMLVPLMLMMMIVIAIVVVPAVLSF